MGRRERIPGPVRRGRLARAAALILQPAGRRGPAAWSRPARLAVLVLLDATPAHPAGRGCALRSDPRSRPALYALHHAGGTEDLRPAAAFWRGYRANSGVPCSLDFPGWRG